MKTRIIHTKFYQDSYVLSLEPLERWFFLYLLTNERVEKTGAYELPLQIAQIESGISVEMMLQFLTKFQNSGKIFYISGYVVIKNILKYQDYSKGSDKQVQSYNEELNALPKDVLEVVLNKDLTSSQLVTNQLPTGSQLVIKHKEEIINNKKKKKEKNKKEKNTNEREVELQQIIKVWNETHGTDIRSSVSWDNLYFTWRESFTLDEICTAIKNMPKHSWLKSREFTPTKFFRTNNDWIEQCLPLGRETSSTGGRSRVTAQSKLEARLQEIQKLQDVYKANKMNLKYGKNGWTVFTSLEEMQKLSKEFLEKNSYLKKELIEIYRQLGKAPPEGIDEKDLDSSGQKV